MISIGRVVVNAGIGSLLEMYDFMIYILLSSILVTVFFAPGDEFSALMQTFCVFAAGFLARPIGAAIFGHFGDRLGRKRILVLTLYLMGIPSLLIAFTPSYHLIGHFAPVCILIWRLVQGIALGGEFSGALTFVAEHSVAHKRAQHIAWIFCFINLGTVLASMITLVAIHQFGAIRWTAWGWRSLFILGSILALFGLYFRNRALETPAFLCERKANNLVENPALEVLHYHKQSLIQGVGLSIATAIAVGMVVMYMTPYLSISLHIPLANAVLINGCSLMILCLMLPCMGSLSDKISRRILLNIALIGIAILSYPLFYYLPLLPNPGKIILLGLFDLFLALLLVNFGVRLTELVPTRIRYSFVGLVYNIPFAIFAGTVPMISLYLIHSWQSLSAPSLYLLASAILGIIVTNIKVKTH